MLNETYDYITLYNKTLFVFESEGVNGKILKGILFESVGNEEWNFHLNLTNENQ